MSAGNALIFIFSRSPGLNEKRLSHRIAQYLESIGIGDIAGIQDIGEQLSLSGGSRRKMIFLNDCNSNCVKMLTNGFHPSEFVYVDVSEEKHRPNFDIDDFLKDKMATLLKQINCEPSVKS